MKFRLRKSNKAGLLTLLGIAIVAGGIFLYRELYVVKTREIEKSVYSYKSTPNVNYEVYLKPNIIFDGGMLPEGQPYITSLVDFMNVSFAHSFEGSKEAKITGSYNITARVGGYSGSGDEIKTIWSKTYTLLPDKKFSVSSDKLEIKEQLKVNMKPYYDFLEQVKNELKINTSTELEVKMNLNYTAETEDGSITEEFSPSLVMPLSSQYFEITKAGTKAKEGDIKKTATEKIPPDYTAVGACAAVLAVLIGSVLFILFAVSEPTDEDIYVHKINQIFRRHSNRLVCVDTDKYDGWDHFCRVHSIEDLVKICDELEKPIMYKHSDDIKEMNEFYVIDSKTIYMYEVQEREN